MQESVLNRYTIEDRENKVEAWREAYNSHDLEKIKDLYDDAFTFTKASLMEAEGRESAKDVAEFTDGWKHRAPSRSKGTPSTAT